MIERSSKPRLVGSSGALAWRRGLSLDSGDECPNSRRPAEPGVVARGILLRRSLVGACLSAKKFTKFRCEYLVNIV